MFGGLGALLLFIFISRNLRSDESRPVNANETMIYKSETTDAVAESYSPGIRGSVGPFPIGKRRERKKTETFENRENRT